MMAVTATAEPPRPAVREKMHRVYDAFVELQPYLAKRSAFSGAENDETIKRLIGELSTQFHGVGEVSGRYAKEPGFDKTLASMRALLEDTRVHFNAGEKLYSYWALRSAKLNCVSCHTRFEVSAEFAATKEPKDLVSLDERADFFLATRQFTKARELFLEAIRSRDKGLDTIDLLRKLLLVHTRVSPSPDQAIADLSSVIDVARITPYERDEVDNWLRSLRAWKAEKNPPGVDPLRKAEELVKVGVDGGAALGESSGEVELFRATAMLHKALESEPALNPESKRKALLLLGVAYQSLPVLFVEDFGDLFLEQCIRDFPDTDDARRAFRVYSNTMQMRYEDNEEGGMPAEIEALLEELKQLAYGIPRVGGRV